MDWIWGALTDMPIPELMQGTHLKPSGPTSHPAAPRTTPVWIPPPQAGTPEQHCRGVSPLASPGSMVAPGAVFRDRAQHRPYDPGGGKEEMPTPRRPELEMLLCRNSYKNTGLSRRTNGQVVQWRKLWSHSAHLHRDTRTQHTRRHTEKK